MAAAVATLSVSVRTSTNLIFSHSQSSCLLSSFTPSSRTACYHRPPLACRSLPIRNCIAPYLPRRSSGPRLLSAAALVDADVVAADVEIDLGGGGGIGGGGEGSGGGGGGGGGGGDREEDSEGGDQEKKKTTGGMSMSQKLTLGYAALVGVGGAMGYAKSGSQKSLAAGGISALLLYYVYTQLPVRPAFASSLGLGISAALLGVMGSRFKKSKKVFPAGVVSVVSLVMVGGYFHGIMRGLHA